MPLTKVQPGAVPEEEMNCIQYIVLFNDNRYFKNHQGEEMGLTVMELHPVGDLIFAYGQG